MGLCTDSAFMDVLWPVQGSRLEVLAGSRMVAGMTGAVDLPEGCDGHAAKGALTTLRRSRWWWGQYKDVVVLAFGGEPRLTERGAWVPRARTDVSAGRERVHAVPWHKRVGCSFVWACCLSQRSGEGLGGLRAAL